ncbi:MAG: aromatic ring-hydroxylating dioxygenase subunit alpha, partial [Anaerolineae bacterium]
KWVDNDMMKMHVFVYNRKDDGTPPLKPNQLPEPRGPFGLEFHFPNLWELHISEHVLIVLAFAPVDEENTVLYLRFYQNFVQVPLLGRLVNWLAMPFNVIVLRQDKRVVITQQPKKTALKMGEKLIQGDRPIVAYRTRRQQLIEEGSPCDAI